MDARSFIDSSYELFFFSGLLNLKSDIQRLVTSGIQVELSWSPGHSNIKGNEYADQMAKEAAEEAKEKMELPPIVTMGDV